METLNHKSAEKGFTIFEMLVVIAIIVMVSSIVLILYNSSRQKSRDSRREEDVKEIRNALNLYVINNKFYPSCGVIGDIDNPDSSSNTYVVINGKSDCFSQPLVQSGSISIVPTDPLGGSQGTCGEAGSHVYCYASDGLNYIFRYSLETNSIPGKSEGWQSIIVKH